MAVFHLKYRPQKIEELDSVEVAQRLKEILREKEIPQAFLFAGPKGAGKTSAARILARAINCLGRVGVEPCGKCESCEEILRGRSLDILEIDAASNRGIDDARSLREQAILLPVGLKTKVFIIDEAQMLTREAFNALLKLLEEPPRHTVFVLCTTDAGKIPETVLSRLTRVDFKKGKKPELKRAIERVIEGEKIEIEPKAVALMVEKSDGSFRNIHRMLDEIVVSCGKKITAGDVEGILARRGGEYLAEELEKDLVEGKLTEILKRLEAGAEMGVDFGELRERLIVYFQQKLLAFYGLGEKSDGLDEVETKKIIELLIEVGKLEKEVTIDQLPLELAVIEFINSKSQITNYKQIPNHKLQTTNKTEEEEKIEIKKEKGIVDLGMVEREWGRVLGAVKPFNHSVEAFLRAARPKEVSGKTLTIEVFYPFHKDRLEEERNRVVVEKGLVTVLGVELQLRCELSQSKKPPLVVKNETPMGEVVPEKKDIYEVAKEIFG